MSPGNEALSPTEVQSLGDSLVAAIGTVMVGKETAIRHALVGLFAGLALGRLVSEETPLGTTWHNYLGTTHIIQHPHGPTEFRAYNPDYSLRTIGGDAMPFQRGFGYEARPGGGFAVSDYLGSNRVSRTESAP